MLPTALPYHTPAQLSRAFFVRRQRTGRQRQNGNPTPRPPQGGSTTSEGSSKAARQFVGSQKTAQQGLTTTQGCGIMWVLPRRAARESDRTSKRVSPQGLALFLFRPGRAPDAAPARGLLGYHGKRDGVRAYPFPPGAAGAAPASRCGPSPALACWPRWRAGRRQAPPSFQTAARAAAGRAPAVARAACLASSQPLAGRASPGLDPGPGVCRFASSVLVARGPPYDGGPAHSSACAPVAWHVAPVSRGLRSAPPALAGPYAASRAGPGASAGCGSSLSALLAALPALRCGVRICQRRAGAVVCPEGKPTACRAWRGV